MKLSCVVALAALHLATTHTLFTTVFINDVDQGDGVCIRMPMAANNATSPVKGTPLSVETACGNGGTTYVNRTCPVPAAAKLTFQFREFPDNATGGALDSSHKGSCAVYMKNVSDPTAPGNGNSWFKIWDEGFDSITSKWCTEKYIMDTNGLLSVRIPGGLPGGYYLVRPELISLHQADKSPTDPQFYTGCAQIFLSPSGIGPNGVLPKDTVSIPGWISADDPGLRYNIYTMNGRYNLPGPMPYPSGNRASILAQHNLHQEFGLLPSDAVVINGNWWASELASYNTSDGCWNASASCYSQLDTCYATAQPTGNTGCKLWEQKCDNIQSACNANNLNGPPDAGKSLIIVPNNPYPIPDAASWTAGIYSGKYNSSIAADGAVDMTIIPTASDTSQATQSITPSTTALRNAATSTTLTSMSKLTSRALRFLTGLVHNAGFVERSGGTLRKGPSGVSRIRNTTITIMNNLASPASQVKNTTITILSQPTSHSSTLRNVTITIMKNLTTPNTGLNSLPYNVSIFTPWSSWDVFSTPSTPVTAGDCSTCQLAQPTATLSKTQSIAPSSAISNPSSSLSQIETST